ncbi:TSC22 domain family protein 4 isoform X1 [Pituophis catenifer annectens]|uniref:TSC22 domain family protein 4 isoform X1 n=1 Tax=Pituophis catenifer annectens TaxID=94852 RepID=UPI0039962546
MSVGKKKSGFQITSVTSDYEKEGLSGGDAKGPSEEPNPVENGSHHLNGGVGPKNGPSAPGSPGTAPLHPGSIGSVAGSRFRVVKLDHGLGEPYKRGRWTCRDFYEQEMDHHLVGRLADSARQPQSLDSRLEVAGLLAKPSSPFSPQMPRRGGPCLQSLLVLPVPAASAHQARSLGGGLPVLRPGRTPPSPASLHSTRVVAEKRPLAPEEGAQEPGDPPQPGTIPVVRVEEHLLPKSVTQLIPRETEERHKILPRETRSRPSSPAPLLFRDASPHRRTSDPFGVARFNLARSVFGMGTSHDSDDDSGTNSSMIAIDNKIEQAMDLVKSHLMFAVREEVEVLREQIKDLSERNAALEQENSLLRSLANTEQTSQFQAQLHENKPSSSGSA